MVIDEVKLRKRIKKHLQHRLECTDFSTDICELVWDDMFSEACQVPTDEEDQEVTRLFERIFKEEVDKLVVVLTAPPQQFFEVKDGAIHIVDKGSIDEKGGG